MSKERFFKGTFLLTSAGLISRIMGFFYRIFLSHTIGAEGIGLYQLVVPLQHLVLAMTTFGIQTALSRLISSHTALGEKKEAQDCFRIGTFLALFLSGIAAWSIFTFSDFFAVQILKEPATESLIRLLALSFPFASVHLCVNSYYLGLKKAYFSRLPHRFWNSSSDFFPPCLLWQICLSRNIAVTAMIAVAGSFLSELAAALCSFICISLNSSVSSHHIEKPVAKNILRSGIWHSPDSEPASSLCTGRHRSCIDSPVSPYVWSLSIRSFESLWSFYRNGSSLHSFSFYRYQLCICHSDALCCGNAGTWTPQKNPLYHTYHLYCLYPSRIFMHHRFLLWGKFCRNHTFP